MKKIFLMTAFIALALSSQAFAAGTDYNSNTGATTDTGTTNVNSDTTSGSATTHNHKRSNTSASSGRHPKAGNLPTHTEDGDDNATSRQGEPSGETNGPVNGQSDDQNYGQPTNH